MRPNEEWAVIVMLFLYSLALNYFSYFIAHFPHLQGSFVSFAALYSPSLELACEGWCGNYNPKAPPLDSLKGGLPLVSLFWRKFPFCKGSVNFAYHFYSKTGQSNYNWLQLALPWAVRFFTFSWTVLKKKMLFTVTEVIKSPALFTISGEESTGAATQRSARFVRCVCQHVCQVEHAWCSACHCRVIHLSCPSSCGQWNF